MKLESIHEHTVDVDRLQGGLVLDVGCRGFHFALAMVARGCRVVALDADPTVTDPQLDGVTFLNLALAASAGARQFLMHENPEARGLNLGQRNVRCPQVDVTAITIAELTQRYLGAGGIWDCVKLDVEGAEYGVLQNWSGPISRQISLEFHEHTFGRQPDQTYEEIFAHLAPWYAVVQHERTEMYCAGKNYWDTLLVSK